MRGRRTLLPREIPDALGKTPLRPIPKTGILQHLLLLTASRAMVHKTLLAV